MKKPLAIDLYAGLGGWTDGLLAEGFDVIGFDIERHVYGEHRYPGQLVIQDMLTVSGAQFKNADCLVMSPPCQEFSYMSMPWSLAKAKAAAIRADTTGAARAELTKLFDACFRIQREACAAAGRHIPMVIENVKGAQPWVGRARWNFGSFYLWGDVPALMPFTFNAVKVAGVNFRGYGTPGYKAVAFNRTAQRRYQDGIKDVPHRMAGYWTNPAEHEGIKQGGSGPAWWRDALNERRREGTAVKNGNDWFGVGADCSVQRRHGSKSTGRKAASAMIAKIPAPLSRWIAECYRP